MAAMAGETPRTPGGQAPGGEPPSAEGASREQLVRERDQALAENRAKSDFLTRVTHELRAPVAGVIGMIDLAIDDVDASTRVAHLSSARASARHLLELIDDLLDASREDVWRFNIVDVSFDLDDVMTQALAMVAPRAQGKGLALAGEVAPGLARQRQGDPLRLRQILINLLYNAVKFTERGAVRARFDAAGPREVRLVVEDSGIGIDPGVQAAVFEPFVRGGVGEGFGLGLAITRELVVALGGRISFTSTPGVGTCFTVVLPLAEATGEPAATGSRHGASEPAAGSTARLRALRPLRVLLVEDHVVNAAFMQVLLERAGHTVRTVGLGHDAVDAAAEGTFDVALMDLELPDLDGFGATRAIRAAEQAGGRRRMPIVGASAHRDYALRSAAAGMDGYLVKPVEAGALAAELERVTADDWRPPIDHAARLKQVGGRAELAVTIAQTFLAHAARLLDPLDEALARDAEEGVRQAAHGLKPSLLMIAARPAAETAAELERAPYERARALRATLAFELARAVAELETAVRRPD
ncbi:MAG TPA: ATP-binding protein [Kofleriaceae bacterium]|nr:ATP-binding protein [Kofleriaceae bacterium]